MHLSARARGPAFFAALTASLCTAGSLAGCAPARAPSVPSVNALPAAPGSSSPASAPVVPRSRPLGAAAARAAGPAAPLRPTEITLDPKQPMRPLPELKVENIGLHVGGGPNDSETKAPFARAIAERFPEFMNCYRKADEPAKGGRFGIDLHIARAGGHARLEQPRTAMHGQGFRECVVATFESVEFAKPARGPTTISYSLHFMLGGTP